MGGGEYDASGRSTSPCAEQLRTSVPFSRYLAVSLLRLVMYRWKVLSCSFLVKWEQQKVWSPLPAKAPKNSKQRDNLSELILTIKTLSTSQKSQRVSGVICMRNQSVAQRCCLIENKMSQEYCDRYNRTSITSTSIRRSPRICIKIIGRLHMDTYTHITNACTLYIPMMQLNW